MKKACRRFYRTIGHGRLIWGILILLLGICPLIQAQSSVQTKLIEDDGNYKIGVGDVLKVDVLKQTILSQDSVRVSNEGTIRLPMLDAAVPAACLTEAQLSQEITERYKKYLLNPQVYVTVKEFNANPVAVGGAVMSPGIFQLKRPMRLLELLSHVNGPALNAGNTIQIIRSQGASRCAQKSSESSDGSAVDEASQLEVISLSLSDVMKSSKNANPYLQGGDIIRVPEAELKQAFIIGSVKTPVTVNLKEPVTLSRAIAMAGGAVQGARIEKVKISRQTTGSLTPTEMLVNLKNINNSSQEDFLLQPNDVVDVPGPKRSFLKSLLNGIIPAVTRMPVVIP